MPRKSYTSVRRSFRKMVPPTACSISSTRHSAIRRWPRLTASRLSTDSIDCSNSSLVVHSTFIIGGMLSGRVVSYIASNRLGIAMRIQLGLVFAFLIVGATYITGTQAHDDHPKPKKVL